MVNFNRNEIVSATQLVRNFSSFINNLVKKKIDKIAIIRNNQIEAVILSIDEYEKLVTDAEKQSVRNYFGSISDEEASRMEQAVSECRKIYPGN